MPCDDCPEKQHLSEHLPGAVYIAYGGGPPSAPFATVARAIPPADERVVTLYGTPTVNPNGTISYPNIHKEGPEPPVPTGYECVPGDNWTLRPVWASCMFRLLRVRFIEDGSLNIAGLCTHPGSGIKAQEPLDPDYCKHCSLRAPIPAPSKSARSAGRSGGLPRS